MRKIHPIKIELVRRGLNQLDLAEVAGIKPSRLNRILNGRVEPQDCELKSLHRALGVQLHEGPA